MRASSPNAPSGVTSRGLTSSSVISGSERERDVGQHFGVDAAEADHRDGSEPRVALDAYDQFDAVAQVRHRFDAITRRV
jgi:hypothetical protein